MGDHSAKQQVRIKNPSIVAALALVVIAIVGLTGWAGTASAQAGATATLTLELRIPNNLDLQFYGNNSVFTLGNFESETLQVDANEAIEVAVIGQLLRDPADYYLDSANCIGPAGPPADIEIDQYGTLTGSLNSGESTRCTYIVKKKTDVTMTIALDAGQSSPDFGMTFRPRPRFAYQGFTLSDGESKTFDARTGEFMKIIGAEETGWDYLGATCVGDRGALSDTFSGTSFVVEGTLRQGVSAVTCTLFVIYNGAEEDLSVMTVTVTCLAGNGRIDANVINGNEDNRRYALRIGALSERTGTAVAGDWWRSSTTGRPDGDYTVTLDVNEGGAQYEEVVTVSCDGPEPVVSSPEVEVLNACRGGYGFIAWQFANPTAQTRPYLITFPSVPNRSTTADAFGAAVRGVSGRPNGTYDFTVSSGDVVVAQSSVTVDC